jgi:2-polyprenyl-6-methoxyphenol hydroxylase-like FAD-dependent oxidoreductase
MIGADGIYSQTRATLFPGAEQPTFTGQMSWRVVAPHPPGLDRTEFFFGHSNIGGINPCSQHEVYAFILNPAPQADRIPDVDQPEYLKNLIKDFGGSMAAIRDGIGPHSSIVQRPFEYCLQPAPWHVGRIILIGDAAHATTPHLASGAGIAVEDGLVLAEELNRCGGDIDAGLQAFTQRRFERCRYVVETSVAIGKRQLEDAPAPEIAERMGKAMHYLAGPI